MNDHGICVNVFSVIIAATCAYALSPLCAFAAYRIGAIDLPSDSRRMHLRPTARLGGLAVYIAFAISSLGVAVLGESALPSVAGGLVIVFGGVLDDVYRISPRQKLLFQVAAAAVAISFGGGMSRSAFAEHLPLTVSAVLSDALSFGWIILLSNAFNLIDGLNGLCARQAIFSGAALFSVSVIAGKVDPVPLIICGAASGFLPHNLPRGTIFLGDTGAMFLGFSLAVSSLGAVNGTASLAAILPIFAFPLGDTAFAVLRRAYLGKSIFEADRGHLHHLLVDSGISHYRASRILSLSAFFMSAAGIIAAVILSRGY